MSCSNSNLSLDNKPIKDDTIDLNNCKLINIGCDQIFSFGSDQEIIVKEEEITESKEEEEEDDFKEELIKVLKEISKILYHIRTEIANK